jgi:AcrR family transcriptional regulator
MIARRSRLAKGTIYLYFSSKEDLYISLIQDGIAILRDKLEKYLQKSEETPPEKLSEIVNIYFNFSQEYKDYFTIFRAVNQTEIINRVDPERLQRFREMEISTFDLALGVIRQGIEQGFFRPDTDIRTFGISLWVGVLGTIVAYTETRETPVLNDVQPNTIVHNVSQSIIASYTK